jgi:hypothetical protein
MHFNLCCGIFERCLLVFGCSCAIVELSYDSRGWTVANDFLELRGFGSLWWVLGSRHKEMRLTRC